MNTAAEANTRPRDHGHRALLTRLDRVNTDDLKTVILVTRALQVGVSRGPSQYRSPALVALDSLGATSLSIAPS
jgi:hypothetical protein